MNRKTIQHCIMAIIIFLVISCLICGCPAKISLDEETQAKLDEDTVYAMEDAMQYLSEKYDMDFKLKSFEPIIWGSTNEDPFVRTEYYGEWEGEFIVNGKTYNISGYMPDSRYANTYQLDEINRYADTYQLKEIQSAYTELMQKYFADICEKDGIVCKAKVLNGLAPNRNVDEVLISVYYDGTNLYDCLKENRLEIDIDITDAGFSEELLRLCENSVAELEKDYEGVKFSVKIIEGKESIHTF